MTLEHDLITDDLFGLLGTMPRPGWVVLDAARDRRFTGELMIDTLPQVHVYLDRGRIYLAERVTDPSLGARLVDSGALNAAQLEHGSLRIGGDEHLGRLFERVPSVDRHAVLITTELMTEECVGWLAHQRIDDLRITPYRHHPAGVHRWERDPNWVELVPGDPLPAPDPSEQPVELTSPEPLFSPEGLLSDDVIQWDEPSWLDERPRDDEDATADVVVAPESIDPTEPTDLARSAAPFAPPPAPSSVPVTSGDWIDRLETDGLPGPEADPLASAATLPRVPVEPTDRFEVIWPSGEIDEQFGATDAADVGAHHPDLDRAGPTARVVRARDDEPDDAPAGDDITDEVVLAVRRAVASIETGALAPRQRLGDDVPDPTPSRGVALPGRHMTRIEPSELSPGVAPPPARSVFDDLPTTLPSARSQAPMPFAEPTAAPELPIVPLVESPADAAPAEPERTSALRRLIGSLRRR